MKWWKERNEKEKKEIINQFKQLKHNDFEKWLLNDSKWKDNLKQENLSAIRGAIEAYIIYFPSEEVLFFLALQKTSENMNCLLHRTTMKKKIMKLIKLFLFLFFSQLLSFKNTIIIGNIKIIKDNSICAKLTLNELLRQCYYCLDEKDFTKLSKMKMDVVDMNDNMIESDEDVMRVLKLKDPTFKLTWTHSGEKKIIRNALVMMIAISEYNEGLEWESLKNVKDKDITNFKKLFEEELKYDFVCNDTPNMTQEDVKDYTESTIINKKLRKNINKYDGLIIIICGHGDDGNVLVTSEGKTVSIDEIHVSFDNCPKIFIIDACRGRSAPHAVEIRGLESNVKPHQIYGHNDDGFLTIWSTTKGHV
ncbi:hypothetical protein RFI_29619, partial [Reticulomyxa filosa]